MSNRIEEEFVASLDPYEVLRPGDGVHIGRHLDALVTGGRTIKCRPRFQKGDPVWWIGERPPYDGTRFGRSPYVVEAVEVIQFSGPIPGRDTETGRLVVYYQVRSLNPEYAERTVQAADYVLRPRQEVEFGSRVRLPAVFPEFVHAGHEALVVDREGDDWILELNCDPSPEEYGENTMLWPVDRSEELTVVE